MPWLIGASFVVGWLLIPPDRSRFFRLAAGEMFVTPKSPLLIEPHGAQPRS
jgi:hypothetical protein